MGASVQLAPTASLDARGLGGEIVAFNIGADGVVYIAVALSPLDYRIKHRSGATFARVISRRPQSYRVLGLTGGQVVLDIEIQRERFNIHDIQPVGHELLLSCARSHNRQLRGPQRNGRIYGRNGAFKRGILLGDGINCIQATSSGVIWTGYFDEGVFGNYGWTAPLGAAGLVAWDADGNKLYEFQPTGGLDMICDCYALNVASDDDVWLYYYTEFPLVHLRRREVVSTWNVPVTGSRAFAVSDGHALFLGGYDHDDICRLLRLESSGKVEELGEIELQNAEGENLVAERTVGRGEAITLLSKGNIYSMTVSKALACVGR
jgi:hypothetical protein